MTHYRTIEDRIAYRGERNGQRIAATVKYRVGLRYTANGFIQTIERPIHAVGPNGEALPMTEYETEKFDEMTRKFFPSTIASLGI